MKKTLPLTLFVALGLGGCGGTTTTIVKTVQVPTATAGTTVAPATTADSTPPPTAPQAPTIGDALTLKGSDVTMRVELLGVIDPATVGEFDSVDGRIVGVRVRMTNVGDNAYSDSPSNGAELITRDDEQADATEMTGGNCAGSFSSSTKIAPGSARVGCIAFDVPIGKKLKTFQFTLDSGFADQTGEWRIPATSGASSGDGAPQPAAPPASEGSTAPAMTACDSNISVDRDTTTCPFANNVFWQYWTGGQVAEVSAWSSALRRYVDVTCESGALVVCTGSEGSRVTFPEAAIQAYSQSQADAYANTHEVRP